MEEISLNDLEVKLVRAIRKWRDEIIRDYGQESLVSDIDVGDAASLASDIATQIIGHGVGIVGEWKADRKLSEGWEEPSK